MTENKAEKNERKLFGKINNKSESLNARLHAARRSN